jgi:D-glycero-alpha-D-manno-heptose-7-phosphate kinase
MIVRSKSPLRLGLAGGGSDVSPFCDIHGGYVLNATIDLHAHCTIETNQNNEIVFDAQDINRNFSCAADAEMPLDGDLILHKAIHNRIVKEFNQGQPLPVTVTTHCDAPPGSGLGSSSTIVVTIMSAYQQLLNLPLGNYDLARLAFDIERNDCQLSGGKQDQYATTFGGFNFMEFYDAGRVVVNPLRIQNHIVNELESQLMLYYTGMSRSSAKIIDDQVKTTSSGHEKSLEAMQQVKALAFEMKERLLMSDINGMSGLLKKSWEAKKKTSSMIANPLIDEVEEKVFSAGAKSIKMSGAGGGGFALIFADPTKRLAIMKALKDMGGSFHGFNFTEEGTQSWTA